MSFVIYDLVFLALFALVAIVFLYRKKHNLKRDSLLYLYRTKIGLRIIEWTSKKYEKVLKPLQYVVVASGYILMATVVWWIGKITYVYLTSPTLAQELRIPVVTPLIPYIDRLFAVDFLPPFYFTYWILIIALIAIPHEFAHGIFARLNKIKIHSTGFGFLGPFLAAFVEQDEKDMKKAKKFPQLAVLAAGTFANVIVTILFGIIIWLFFVIAFTPAGVYIGGYSVSTLDISKISPLNSSLENYSLPSFLDDGFIKVSSEGKTYFINSNSISLVSEQNITFIYAYDDAPAINSGLNGIITRVDETNIESYDQLRKVIISHSPGESISIITLIEENLTKTNIILGERDGKAFLGIAGISPLTKPSGFNKLYQFFDPVKYHTYISGTYYSSLLGDFGLFIYQFLWWAIIISFSVALMNMLPVGIFDGGRFFYLTIWGITGSEKIGARAFKISTWLILLVLLAWMIKWLVAVVL